MPKGDENKGDENEGDENEGDENKGDENKPKLDIATTSFANGRRLAIADNTADLVKMFGTSDPVELAAIAATAKGATVVEPDPAHIAQAQQLETVTKQNEALLLEKSQMGLQMLQQAKLTGARSPIAATGILDALNHEYDFKEVGAELMAYKKDGTPAYIEGTGNVKTFEQCVDILKKDEATSFYFKDGSPEDDLLTPNESDGLSTKEGLSKLTPEQLSDPRIHAFAAQTNQAPALMSGKPINLTGYDAFAAKKS